MEFSGIKETARLEAFSDGVFAIVITLLALELHIPESTAPENLLLVLKEQWPAYLSFFTSFFTVLIMWVNHHAIFRFIKKADNQFIYLNGLLLCLVTILPFTTALVARYISSSAATIVMLIYCIQFLLINGLFNGLWYAVRIHKSMDRHPLLAMEIRKMTLSYAAGFPVYLIALFVALFNPLASLLICFGLWIVWAYLMSQVNFKLLSSVHQTPLSHE